uniref:Transmembrane protein n=1 Tax=Pithovirus LCPAC403 TaxID=2506596 RepID=A0A481ZAU9_9VIRU|nr:MAG: uncharacterized protein LCPAC403_00310 [Pithovirus LCPAC403]
MAFVPQNYYLRGSIPETSQIYIITVDDNGILYYLTVLEDASIMFLPNGQTLSPSPTLFSFQTAGSGVTFSTVFRGIMYNISSMGDTISDVQISEANLTMLPSIVEVVTVEASNYSTILVGVEYTFFTLDGSPMAFPSSIDIFQTKMRFLPSVIYPMGLCTEPITDVAQIKGMEQDWVDGLNPDKGFANITACSEGFFFDYCPYKQICSTKCKGICDDGVSRCSFSNKTDSFSCVVNPSTFIEQSRTPLQSWMIWVIIIIIAIIIFIIMFFLFVGVHRTRDHQKIGEGKDIENSIDFVEST